VSPARNRSGASAVLFPSKGGTTYMSLLWIILIVVLVLALLGFFSRGYW
jgi:flagellar basal body-associated protein FliL